MGKLKAWALEYGHMDDQDDGSAEQFYAEVMAEKEWREQYDAETNSILMGAPRPLTVAGENDVITCK